MTDATQTFESDGTADAVYYDRNLPAQALAAMASEAGYPVWWEDNADDPDWPILFIQLPTGQVSYHIPVAERLTVTFDLHDPRPWDGHDLDLKQQRLIAFTWGRTKPLTEIIPTLTYGARMAEKADQ